MMRYDYLYIMSYLLTSAPVDPTEPTTVSHTLIFSADCSPSRLVRDPRTSSYRVNACVTPSSVCDISRAVGSPGADYRQFVRQMSPPSTPRHRAVRRGFRMSRRAAASSSHRCTMIALYAPYSHVLAARYTRVVLAAGEYFLPVRET